MLIEVKDTRGYRVENRHRDFAREVADKVRDTLAGLFWAARRQQDVAHEISQLTHLISRRDTQKVLVVLWLDEDRSDPAAATILAEALRSALRPFLNAKAIVTSTELEANSTSPLTWVSAG